MTAWTVTHQVSLALGFSRQEYWIGFPFPSLGNLPDPGIELGSPALQADSLPSEPSLLYFSLIFFLFYFLLYNLLWANALIRLWGTFKMSSRNGNLSLFQHGNVVSPDVSNVPNGDFQRRVLH